ncbi:signal peptidase I [Dactylosporangium aurantiacum]|uniref:Signal peptidase I n=1 Tax=Dactylosporangium aurantiacum TaxID=35754 RepID=A0A9Q9INP2_9ACTN|nr:signal peptidase I [Dactylosporangium aurantiacum]MDG6103976.1 signal peptidase I [Dactylosporangium aurantiacum]UWZ58846.1 signal peptidase I [Dactylosporangium aurantiacum]
MTQLFARVSATVLMFFAGLVAATVIPTAFGWSASVVVSGSMTPAIAIGDVVVAAPVRDADIRPGRVLRFRDPSDPRRFVLHRVVAVGADGTVVTKGDAAAAADSAHVSVADVTGRAALRVPWVGLPGLWLRDGAYGNLAGLGVALVLLSALASRGMAADRA